MGERGGAFESPAGTYSTCRRPSYLTTPTLKTWTATTKEEREREEEREVNMGPLPSLLCLPDPLAFPLSLSLAVLSALTRGRESC